MELKNFSFTHILNSHSNESTSSDDDINIESGPESLLKCKLASLEENQKDFIKEALVESALIKLEVSRKRKYQREQILEDRKASTIKRILNKQSGVKNDAKTFSTDKPSNERNFSISSSTSDFNYFYFSSNETTFLTFNKNKLFNQ